MSTGWSPFLSSSSSDAEANDEALAREIEMLERAVRDRGELRRRERFGRALRAAVRQGRNGHPRRGYYGPPDA